MKIALFGYGKMGKIIENIAINRGHNIVAKFDAVLKEGSLTDADVAIDFSLPSVAFDNIKKCFNNNIPIVSGTTGWVDKLDEANALCKAKDAAFIYASNFSLGVNLFFELNAHLAQIMNKFKSYQISLEEIHHSQKLDAPSGTAISLAEDIIKRSDKKTWSLGQSQNDNDLTIVSKRINDVPGTHKVRYESPIDHIQIEHKAKNRDGFALGAVMAAEWLKDKKGVYTMKDVLAI